MSRSCYPLRVAWPRTCALLNLAALASAAAWVAIDPEFGGAARGLGVLIRYSLGQEPLPALNKHLAGRVFAFELLAGLGVLSGLGLAMGLFLGRVRSRGLQGWLIVVTLVAGWLGLASGWGDLAWWGKQRRMAGQLERFQPAADALRQHWPQADGALPEVGPFSAYPIGQTSTLLVLSRPSDPVHTTWFAEIELGREGTLRFALAGAERGDWLEWHPEGRSPGSFTGGLGDRHELARSAPLGGGWHLSRYQPDVAESR